MRRVWRHSKRQTPSCLWEWYSICSDNKALLETPTCRTQDVPATDQISFETPARKDSGHLQHSEENVGESQDDEQDVELGESQEKHDAKVEETAQESIRPVATRQTL
jgi:hypothetical protein